MMTPEAFFGIFTTFNTTWLPILLVLWIALILCTILVFWKSNDATNILMKVCLAVIFAWNGIVFFFLHMKQSAIPGGIPMIAIAIFFSLDVFRNTITFSLPEKGWYRSIILCIIFWALGLYTVAGWSIGHPYPGGPLPVAPCPMTMFAIALLSTSMETLKTDRKMFTLLHLFLFWWSLYAGLGAPILFGFYLDFTLLFVGIYGVVMLVRHWKIAS